MRAPRAAAPVALLVVAVALIWAPAALAHARLVGTTSETGSTVRRQPAEVIFKYDQPVGGTDGAVRVGRVCPEPVSVFTCKSTV